MRYLRAALILLASCAERPGDVAPATASPLAGTRPTAAPAAQTSAGEPPRLTFTPPQPWHSWKTPDERIAPPDPTKETWRVLVHQRQPMQVPTPKWQRLPATETVPVAMQPESRFRCVVGPLTVEAKANDPATELEAWTLRRDLLCSGDGWQTWTQHEHALHLLPDGTRRTVTAAQASLREHTGDPRARETVVLVRDDEELRTATTGPPRVLPGAAVDD
jgi:hypothetical protein